MNYCSAKKCKKEAFPQTVTVTFEWKETGSLLVEQHWFVWINLVYSSLSRLCNGDSDVHGEGPSPPHEQAKGGTH